MDAKHTPHVRSNGRRYTVNEAAAVLGISAEAVRARINRGTLHKEKDADGTVYVRMNDDHTHPDDRTNGRTNGDDTADHTVPNESVAFQIMQDQIEFLRAELERKDMILLTMAQRIPELEAAPEPRESPQTSSDQRGNNGAAYPEDGGAEKPSWWRRFFGVE
jgi:hypothetical protein